jgi:phospholipase D1/2
MCLSDVQLLLIALTLSIRQAYLPKVKAGHVAANLTPAQITEQLGRIRGHLVQAANDFLIEEDGLISGIFWSTMNPLLPIWV